jgi:transposase
MRGSENKQTTLFSYVSMEHRIPDNHPLREIRKLVDEALKPLHELFSELYSHTGRPSIPPEYLLRASLLQIFYTIRSERQLMEQLDYNLLFRWFVGLSMDDPAWDHSVFSKNRDRLLNTGITSSFFSSVRDIAKQKNLVSDEHFSVDGTLLEAWASMKSFRPEDHSDNSDHGSGRNPEVDFRGQKRTNDTHASVTDPDARLYKKAKGQQARLCYMGHALMENRNGLVVDACVTHANGTAERTAAIEMIGHIPGRHRITIGADKGYDCADFVNSCRDLKATAHVARKEKGSGIDGRTTRHEGYGISLRIRKRVEEVFGWLKTVGCLDKLHHRGIERVNPVFKLSTAAYNLIRIRNLTAAEVT